MPELPEVETTRRGISPHICGQRLIAINIRQPQLRWPIPPELPERVKDARLMTIDRRGKYLLLNFNNATTLLWHLGMSGSLRIVTQDQPPQRHDHVDLTFSNQRILRFHDPRRFGALLYTQDYTQDNSAQHSLLAHLGPEPLSPAFNDDYLYARSRKRTQAIKTFIMDSRIVVGVGNIYANEALFQAGIHPLKAAGKLSRDRYNKLVDAIKTILSQAITQGGTTLRDFVGGDGKPGYFAQQLRVYGRAKSPCVQCAKPLTEKRIAQRSTVFCTHCQR